MLRIALILTISSALLAADQTWTHLQTEHFELYTTAGEKRGREAILYYEQVRALFAKLFKSAAASKLPVRIIAFRNEKEFIPFRPSQAAAAYYSPGLERDYIVMQSIASENFPIAVHEYTHRVIHSMGIDPPIWMNEGMAELFATLKPVGNKVQMGEMDVNRATVMRTNKTIPFAQFLTVDHESALYNERNKAGLFYAQAFALAHMLYFDETYKTKVGNLQLAFMKTKDPREAFQLVYGLTLEAVQRDLDAYMRQDRFFYGIVDVKLEKSAETAEARPVDDYEAKTVIADLYRVSKKWDESARVYQSALQIDAKRPDAEEGLGWLALYQNKHAEALPHFARAIELGSKSPVVCENAARLSWNDAKRALGYMKKAVELDPDLKDGNYTLGTIALNAHEPKTALDALSKIKKVTPDRASALFRAMAHAYLALQSYDDARKNAELAKKYAKTDEERRGAEELLTYFEGRDRMTQARTSGKDEGPPKMAYRAPSEPLVTTRPIVREPRKVVSGALLEVACQGKQARLTVADSGTKSVYLISDPDRIDVRNAEGVTHEFTCGPQQNTRVKLEYVDPTDVPAGVAGIVRSIEFIK